MEIANRPGMSVQSVKHFVLTTHWDPPHDLPLRMPNLMLLSTQADDVAMYLTSLSKARGESQSSAPPRP